MIQNVKSGDKITAEQQNQIIDGVNELMNGSYTVNDFGGVGKMTSLTSYSCMFQVKQQMGFTMTSRPNTYSNTKMKTTWMLFGASLASFKKMVGLPTSGKVWLINSNNSSAEGQVQEEWIKRGGSDQYYDGWVDLQYPQYTPVYAIRCQVVKKDTGVPSGDYFVIDSESNQEEIGNNLLTKLGLTPSEYKVNVGLYLIIAEYTVAGTMKGDSGSGPKFRQLTQFHVGALVAGGYSNSYTGDSQLSDLQLCSIVQATLSGDNYFKLFEFDDPYNQVSATPTMDILVREQKPASGSPSGYKATLKYVNLSGLLSSISGTSLSGDSQIPYTATYSVSVNTDANVITLYSFADFDNQVTPRKEYHDVLVRNKNNGKLEYIQLSSISGSGGDAQLSNVIGDSNTTGYKQSIDVQSKDDYRVVKLYNWDDPYKIEQPDPRWHDVLLRYHSGNQVILEYSPLSAVVPEYTIDTNCLQISADYYGRTRRISFLNFDQPYGSTVYNSFGGNHFYNLANGATCGYADDWNDFFLVRDQRTGKLTYKKIYAKGGQWDEDRVKRLEDIVDGQGSDIGDIYNITYENTQNITQLSGIVEDISASQGSYWEKGGGAEECYGSEIGDGSGAVIDLAGKELLGQWSADETFTAGSLIGTQSIYTEGSLRAEGEGWFGSQVWSSQKIWCGGDLETLSNLVAGGSLTLGSTSLDEATLQALLSLLSASTDSMNKQY